MHLNHKLKFISAFTALIISAFSNAQSNERSDDELLQLEPYLIEGAYRQLSDVRSTPVAVSYLTASELTGSLYVDIEQALNQLPGITATIAGDEGANKEIYIRGQAPTRSSVVVDGIRTNTSIFTGGRFIHGLDAWEVDRIELIRGPQSAIYGTNSIGGVLLVSSLPGSDEAISRLNLEYGSHESFVGAVSTEGSVNAFRYKASASYQEEENILTEDIGESTAASLRLDYAINEQWDIGGTLRYNKVDFANPGGNLNTFGSATIQSEAYLATAFAEFSSSENWYSKWLIGYLEEDYTQQNFDYTGVSNQFTLDWQNDFVINDEFQLSAGLMLEQQEGIDSSMSSAVEADNYAVYIQGIYNPDERTELSAGIRYDDYEFGGGDVTYRLSGSYELSESLYLKGNFGTSFRAPAIFRIFSESFFAAGNPDLKNEYGYGWDVGLVYYSPDAKWDATAFVFQSSTEDLIDFVSTGGFSGTFVNRNQYDVTGVELQFNYQLAESTTAYLSATYIDNEIDNETSIMRQPNVPVYQYSIGINSKVTEQFTIGGNVLIALDRVSFGAVPVDDYTLARLYAKYQINESLSVHARIENLFDQEFAITASSFQGILPARELSFYGGVTARF